MTDERFPDDIQSIADALASLPPEALELRSLLERHPQLTPPDVQQVRQALLDAASGTGGPGGALSLVSQTGVGQDTGGTIGIYPDLSYGQGNLLEDPVFELMDSTAYNIGAAATNVGFGWRADYDIVSGAGPSTCDWNQLHFRISDPANNPFSSAEVEFQVNIPASATVFDVYAYPNQGHSPGLIPLLPFLIASVKLRRTSSSTPAAGCSLAITMQVYRVDDATVVAESTPIDYATLTDFDEVRTLWAAAEQAAADWVANTYLWRLKLHYVGTGNASSAIRVSIGEPIFQWWQTEQSPPFNPFIGKWAPMQLFGLEMPNVFLIETSRPLDTNDRFTVDRDGNVSWGGGSAVVDTNLYRAGANHLKTDDKFTATGGFAGGGTSFPGTPATGDRYFRTDRRMEFVYDGTRWLSTTLYQISWGTDRSANAHLPLNASLGSASLVASPPLAGCTDIWIEDAAVMFHVASGGTALGASHKWEGQLTKQVDGGGQTNIGAVVSIASGSSAVWRVSEQTIDALMNNGTVHDGWSIGWTKTGTPGDLYYAVTLTYRMVG